MAVVCRPVQSQEEVWSACCSACDAVHDFEHPSVPMDERRRDPETHQRLRAHGLDTICNLEWHSASHMHEGPPLFSSNMT
mmetsp:Transcript_84660/g.154967  ORF Transcript_84660/g.154967 Transcript_84660/m.154967 type:complete len:80 (-) Transcript_84660:27-266(-)